MSRARFRVTEGSPLVLGPTVGADGVCFALYAPNASRVELCLFEVEGAIVAGYHHLRGACEGTDAAARARAAPPARHNRGARQSLRRRSSRQARRHEPRADAHPRVL